LHLKHIIDTFRFNKYNRNIKRWKYGSVLNIMADVLTDKIVKLNSKSFFVWVLSLMSPLWIYYMKHI